jgi:hypothetical protein
MYVMLYWCRMTTNDQHTSPQRVHACSPTGRDLPMLVTAFLWAVSYLGALLLLKHIDLTAPVKVAVALLPAIPFAAFLLLFIKHLRNFDELWRRVHLEALAFAFPVAILMLMVLGLLELAHPLPPKDWSYRHVWYYLPLFYFFGLMVSWRRYR